MVTSSRLTASSTRGGRCRSLTSAYSISEPRLITKETNMPNIEVSSFTSSDENKGLAVYELLLDVAFTKHRKQSM